MNVLAPNTICDGAIRSDSLRETIRALEREVLRNIFPTTPQPQVASLCDVIREEVKQIMKYVSLQYIDWENTSSVLSAITKHGASVDGGGFRVAYLPIHSHGYYPGCYYGRPDFGEDWDKSISGTAQEIDLVIFLSDSKALQRCDLFRFAYCSAARANETRLGGDLVFCFFGDSYESTTESQ